MTHPRYYWTADRSTLVEESDTRGAFLAYGVADTIPPEHLALLGKPAAATPPETVALIHAGEVILPAAVAKPSRKPARRR
jgi:hypothetical protein